MTPVEAVTKPIAGGHCGIDMRRVLHVGPVNTPGGMGKVIQILYSAPPEGWEAETLDSHSTMGVIAKIIAMRRARKFIRQNGHSFDIIHFHSAADWSWFRKIHLLKQARKPMQKLSSISIVDALIRGRVSMVKGMVTIIGRRWRALTS